MGGAPGDVTICHLTPRGGGLSESSLQDLRRSWMREDAATQQLLPPDIKTAPRPIFNVSNFLTAAPTPCRHRHHGGTHGGGQQPPVSWCHQPLRHHPVMWLFTTTSRSPKAQEHTRRQIAIRMSKSPLEWFLVRWRSSQELAAGCKRVPPAAADVDSNTANAVKQTSCGQRVHAN